MLWAFEEKSFMMFKLSSVVAVTLSALAVAETRPAENGHDAVGQIKPDPAVVAKLEALGENEIVKLTQANIVGAFNDVARKYGLDRNGPGIREYCLKMPWAEDRKRAFYCGGNHGVPHGLNDIWEYDLPANTWNLLWAPEDFTRNAGRGKWEDAIIKDGILQSKRGATIQASHTWDQLTYDPEIKALVWLTAWNIDENMKNVGLLERWKSKENRHPVPLWGYYTETNSWKPLGVDQNPTLPNNASLLCYIPELHGTIYYGKWDYKTLLWDNRTGKWSLFCARQQGPSDEMLSCYSAKNKVVVAVCSSDKGGGTYYFDPAQKTWSTAVPYEAGKTPKAYDFTAVIGDDPVTGTCLLFTNDKETFGFWAYDVGAKQWTRLMPKGDMPQAGPDPTHGYNGYFDPVRSVFVLFKNAGREVWAYRYKKIKK